MLCPTATGFSLFDNWEYKSHIIKNGKVESWSGFIRWFEYYNHIIPDTNKALDQE